MIATLVMFGGEALDRLAATLAWGSVVGSGLQFGAQLPVVFALAKRLSFHIETRAPQVREVLRNFGPVFVSRGVVQISGFVDSLLASLLPQGAMAALLNAQSLSLLPVSLFGMSVSAAELPAMSSVLGDREAVYLGLRQRLNGGLRRIAFFVVPSAVGFLAFGDVIVAALFQSGRFSHADSVYVWGILAGSAVGLLATTMGRLYSSTYYAMRDTRTPLRFAVIRVALTTALGYVAAKPLPVWIGINPRWGVAGLTASAGIAGWVEFALLRRTLNRRIGATGLAPALAAKLWIAAIAGAAAGWGVRIALGRRNAIVAAIAILGVYGVAYFGAAAALRVQEGVEVLRRIPLRATKTR
jgi:putative peptidoglycan lipid II flippase